MIIPRYQHVPYGALGEPECILLHYKRFCLEKNPPYKRVHYTVQSEKPNVNRTLNSNMVVHRGINNFVFSNTCNTTGVTSGAGTAYPSRLHEFTPTPAF
jgi:hypothetical protein